MERVVQERMKSSLSGWDMIDGAGRVNFWSTSAAPRSPLFQPDSLVFLSEGSEVPELCQSTSWHSYSGSAVLQSVLSLRLSSKIERKGKGNWICC